MSNALNYTIIPLFYTICQSKNNKKQNCIQKNSHLLISGYLNFNYSAFSSATTSASTSFSI